MHVEVLHSHMTLSQVKDKFKRDTLHDFPTSDEDFS